MTPVEGVALEDEHALSVHELNKATAVYRFRVESENHRKKIKAFLESLSNTHQVALFRSDALTPIN